MGSLWTKIKVKMFLLLNSTESHFGLLTPGEYYPMLSPQTTSWLFQSRGSQPHTATLTVETMGFPFLDHAIQGINMWNVLYYTKNSTVEWNHLQCVSEWLLAIGQKQYCIYCHLIVFFLITSWLVIVPKIFA